MPHVNDDAELTVRELRAAARRQAEENWRSGSPGGSDKRYEARGFVDQVIDNALKGRRVVIHAHDMISFPPDNRTFDDSGEGQF